jgi:hypothetical protein
LPGNEAIRLFLSVQGWGLSEGKLKMKNLIFSLIIFLLLFPGMAYGDRSVDQAINWGLTQMPGSEWYLRCLEFAEQSYNTSTIPGAPFGSAWNAWNDTRGYFGPQNPPGTFIPHGALVFFQYISTIWSFRNLYWKWHDDTCRNT